MNRILAAGMLILALACMCTGAAALDRPWIADVFFYWYLWDDQRQWGNWGDAGVYYTPLAGHYDSRSLEANYRQIQMAAEWGMTHHFMDYWSPDWQGEGGAPRDLILMQAAEQARQAGYQAWMGYYQDGTNFEMGEFSRNVSERRDVYHWLKHYAPLEAWPRLNGYPFQMVYARSGAPQVTIDHQGFRQFARERYRNLEEANHTWGTHYGAWDEVMMALDGRGPQRADAVDYQYLRWEQEWARLNRLVREEFGYPGIKASFDVGYGPYRGLGFGDFARVFGGPHSYGGTFGPPHDQDAQRFIQSIVARRWDTVFFDHLKGYYCDWNTLGRIPGTQYPAEPFAYDRFWVGNLMRYNQAVLHLSWNEWWEGSQLEPSLELGKRYCEQNLFYSTLMQECFDSLRNFGRGATVAVLLNDWAFKCGSDHTSEVYALLQELRRSMVPFDLLVDDLVTAETLRRFDLVFAPAAQVGFGRNGRGQWIAPLLAEWVRADRRRRLVVSDCPQMRSLLGLRVEPPPETAAPGPDLSVFIDVGRLGDQQILRGGYSGAEDWSQLPPGAPGHTEERYTVRWLPGEASVTRLLLPVSPNRNHLLRFAGSAFWPSALSVRVNRRELDRVEIAEGRHEYRALIARSAVGPHHFLEVELWFDPLRRPQEIDPQRFARETRACNLALEWVQISTANLDFSRAWTYSPPAHLVEFRSSLYGALNGQTRPGLDLRRDYLAAPEGQVLARYRESGKPRDLLLLDGRVLYVNGQMDDVAPDLWTAAVLERWAGARAPTRVRGDHIIGAQLQAGNTVLLLAYNYDSTQERAVEFTVDTRGQAVAAVTALRRDGEAYRPLPWRAEEGRVAFSDRLRYFGVYEVVLSPVKAEMTPAALRPGEQGRVGVTITGGLREESGSVALEAVIPSLRQVGGPTAFRVRPGERVRLDLPVAVREDANWGEKTVIVRLHTARGAAAIFRPLVIEPPADVQPVEAVIDGSNPRLTLVNQPPPAAARCARASAVTVEAAGRSIAFGDVASGDQVTRTLPLAPGFAARPRLIKLPITISYETGGRRVSRDFTLPVALPPQQPAGPAQALGAVYLYNPADHPLDNHPVVIGLPRSLAALAERLYVTDGEGQPLPSQVDFGREVAFVAQVPRESAAAFYLALAPSSAERPTAPGEMELTVEALSALGSVRLSNSRLTMLILASRGGALASLRSQASGREFAADSLGVAHGDWSRPVDPQHPARTPAELIAERRVRQSDSLAQVETLAQGPVRAMVQVTWQDERVQARQVYELRAYQPYLRVRSEARPRGELAAQELVLLDGRFRAEGFTKIYPGFSGMLGQFDREHPHFGWREVDRVPALATMMQPPHFVESLSLVLTRTRGADRWRQGFWPENRPQPGLVKYAWCEVISTEAGGGQVEAYLLLHDGNQAAAQRFRQELERQPLALVVGLSREWQQAAPATTSRPADWWSPHWPLRVPVTVRPSPGGTAPELISVTLEPAALGAEPAAMALLDPASVRVIEYERGRPSADVPAAAVRTADALAVHWETPPSPRDERSYYIYLDTVGAVHRIVERSARMVAPFADPSLEAQGRFWALEGAARWWREEARSGQVAARLESDDAGGVGLLQMPGFPARPGATYRVAFWAKVVEGDEGLLRVNFYLDAAHDFEQQQVIVPADGRWHRLEVAAPVGDLPPRARPALRIWAIERRQAVLVDDITVETPAAAADITLGPLETL